MQALDFKALLSTLADLPDPRSERNQEHPLLSILFIAICGAISGADNWVDIEAYGKAKVEWLKTLIDLPYGIPSHDTFGRVFRFLNPQAFQAGFLDWISGIGKQMRGAKDVPTGQAGLYMVSAWAVEQGIVLGQRQVDAKSNEITAIPELLDVLALEGCVVTIDAMGCQTEIAEQIIRQQGDYMLAVKGNQGTLVEDISDLFAGFEQTHWQEAAHDYHKTVNKGHARETVKDNV